MGGQGTAQNVLFEIRSGCYAGLKDERGENVGCVGTRLAAPHLFYLTYPTTGNAGLFSRKIKVHDVADASARMEKARDQGGLDPDCEFDLSITSVY